MSVDEKKPPVGGVLDINRLAMQHRVLSQLLAAFDALGGAGHSCTARRGCMFPAAAAAIDAFLERDAKRLISEVVPLLELIETPEEFEERVGLRPARQAGRGSQCSSTSTLVR